jgi:tRNA threonylcarbamoyladenosine biosynthesis protein TsaE
MEALRELHIENEAELTRVAKEFLELIGERKIICFNGQMGAGKTTFVKALLKAMDARDDGSSPTFSLINEYESYMYGSIFHFDLYRINSMEEALDIGIEEIIYQDNVCFIEWPDKILNLLPDDYVEVTIHVNEDNSRTLTIEL